MSDRPAPRADAPVSEFICPGCGRPLEITLHSDFCLAEAQVYCPDCERDYQQRRGVWIDLPRAATSGDDDPHRAAKAAASASKSDCDQIAGDPSSI